MNRSLLVAGLAILVHDPVVAQAGELAGLDGYIEQSMATWKIPGLAIAVVKDGKVALAKGYGIREVGRPYPVTANTLFAIGSATKGFTATLAGILAERGKLDLDAPATRYLPDFALADPRYTSDITVRDLMTHRTGVAGGDLLWASGALTRTDIVHRIRYVPVTWSLRSRFDYSNIMFIAAGEAIAAVGGADLDALFRREILDPLGMTSTTTSVRALPKGGDVATPHDPQANGPVPVPWRNMDNTLAGGGINSSVAEMAQWLRFQLGKGQLDGKRLVSEKFIDATRTPETVIRREGAWALMTPDAHFMSYGLGWFLSDYHGHQMLQHGGGIDGMSAMVGLMPEIGVGVVVLTNLNGNLLPGALMHRVFDAYLGRPARDWSEQARAMVTEGVKAGEAAEAARQKGVVAGTKPTLPLAGYVGTYRHPAWGDLTISQRGDTLFAKYGTEFEGPLEHVQFDTFRARWTNPARGNDYLNFTIDVFRKAARADLYLWVTASFDRVNDPVPPQDPDSDRLRAATKALPELSVERAELKVNLAGPSAIATDPQGRIYVLDRPADGDPVIVLDRSGKVLRSWGKGMFAIPHGIRVDPEGNVWTVDAHSSMVYKFSPEGKKLLEISVGDIPDTSRAFCGATDIAFARGRIFVSDGYCNARVIEYDARGRKVTQWGRPGTGPGEFKLVHAIAVGPDGNLYVADRENGRVQRFTLDGKFLGEWRYGGQLFNVAFSRKGEVYVSTHPKIPSLDDDFNIVKVDPKTGAMLSRLGVVSHELTVGSDGVLYPGTRKPQLLLFRPR